MAVPYKHRFEAAGILAGGRRQVALQGDGDAVRVAEEEVVCQIHAQQQLAVLFFRAALLALCICDPIRQCKICPTTVQWMRVQGIMIEAFFLMLIMDSSTDSIVGRKAYQNKPLTQETCSSIERVKTSCLSACFSLHSLHWGQVQSAQRDSHTGVCLTSRHSVSDAECHLRKSGPTCSQLPGSFIVIRVPD